MSQIADQLAGFAPDAVVSNLPKSVQVFVVGGAVRDALLGLPASDRDWVVVGAEAKDLIKAGFLPVGQDFPVFLHPRTNEEYALARTERKSGQGYKGFVFYASPDVSLEQDLLRRDFTVNAMAMDQTGAIIDPCGGRTDLQAKVFRHVSPAFSEDPLRVLRLARFLARFHEFSVAPETLALCQELVDAGEMGHLVSERVFVELDRTIAASAPAQGWSFLAQLGVWATLCDQAPLAWRSLTDRDSRTLNAPLDRHWTRVSKWAWWLARAGEIASIKAVCSALKVPNEIRELACVWRALEDFLKRSEVAIQSADEWLELLGQVDLYRKSERLHQVNQAFQQVCGTHAVFKVLDALLDDVFSGRFKQAQRDYLKAHADEQPVKVIQAFRAEWLQRHLQGVWP